MVETTTGPLICLRGVTKVYHTGEVECRALDGVDLVVGSGEFVSIMGRSGSGKSTLINMITGIDHPTRGEVVVGGTSVHRLKESLLAPWRGRTIGVVFQFFQLLPTLTVLENILLPMDFAGNSPKGGREARALHLLELVGVSDQAHKLPSALSGGQQQRVAIARALANDPPVLAADEPTGNLDSRTAEAVLELFDTLVSEGKTIVMVTHDRELAARATRQLEVADGRVVYDGSRGTGPSGPCGGSALPNPAATSSGAASPEALVPTRADGDILTLTPRGSL